MTTKAVRYTQPLLGDMPGDVLVLIDPTEVNEIVIRQDGDACTVYGSNDKGALANPVPLGVAVGTAGLSTRGELLIYLEAGNGYDARIMVGAGDEAVVSIVPLPDIAPDVADVATAESVAAEIAGLLDALGDLSDAIAAEAAARVAMSFEHVQASAAATWTVNHGLGRRPSVSVLDSAGTEVLGEVAHPSDDQTVLTFAAAFSGTAYLI